MSNRMKAILIVIAGLVLVAIGVISSILLIQRLQANKPTVEESGATVKTNVIIVTRDLFLGDRISAQDIRVSEVPVEFAPRDAFSNIDEAIGKIIKTDLFQGEILLKHNLADPTNNNRDLSFVLSEDHVLLAFPALDLMSRESMINRGDIVDILATFQQTIKTVPNTVNYDPTNPVPTGQEETIKRTFTVNAFQKVSITAMVLEIITEENNTTPLQGNANSVPTSQIPKIKAYLLALDPQDALVLKHLKDTEASFDIVLRAPTSSVQFGLTPVTEEYIIEYYGLEILP